MGGRWFFQRSANFWPPGGKAGSSGFIWILNRKKKRERDKKKKKRFSEIRFELNPHWQEFDRK